MTSNVHALVTLAQREHATVHLRLTRVALTATFKVFGKKRIVVRTPADGANVEQLLRTLLRDVKETLDLSPDPAFDQDAFVRSLDAQQRVRLLALLKNLRLFKEEVTHGWSAASVEPFLAPPRSGLQPEPLNICGTSDE